MYLFALNLPASQKIGIKVGVHQGRSHNLKIPEDVICFNPAQPEGGDQFPRVPRVLVPDKQQRQSVPVFDIKSSSPRSKLKLTILTSQSGQVTLRCCSKSIASQPVKLVIKVSSAAFLQVCGDYWCGPFLFHTTPPSAQVCQTESPASVCVWGGASCSSLAMDRTN